VRFRLSMLTNDVLGPIVAFVVNNRQLIPEIDWQPCGADRGKEHSKILGFVERRDSKAHHTGVANDSIAGGTLAKSVQ
jgi:hypothetical protein